MLTIQLKPENQICPAKSEVNKKTTVKLVKSKPTQQRQIWLHGLCRNKNPEALALEVKEIKVGTTFSVGKLGAGECGLWTRRSLKTNVSPASWSFFP